jgi:hypothetical protein
MDHQVPLREIPPELAVPDELKQRFRYDDQRKRLCFDGFMSKAVFDRLEKLDADSDFQHALDELFRISTPEDSGEGRQQTRIVVAVVIATVALVCVAVLIWLSLRE